MTYATGGRIQAADHNSASTYLADIWGVGNGRFGYGQSTTYIAPVAVGDLIRNDEWNNLDTVLELTTQHQAIVPYVPSSYDPGFVSVVGGTSIRPWTHYVPYIQRSYANCGNVYSVTDSVADTTTYTGYWGHDNSRTLSMTQTLTFASADAARYFFNSGGKIKLSFAHTGGITSRDSLWRRLCTDAGTIEIGYQNTKKLGGNALATDYTILNNNNGGYWANMNGHPLEHYRQFPSISNSPYGYGYGYGYGYNNPYYYNSYYGGQDTLDYIQVLVSTAGSAGTHGGLGVDLVITTNFVNGTIISPTGNDFVTGTTTTSLIKAAPGLSYITPSWGSIDFRGATSLV